MVAAWCACSGCRLTVWSPTSATQRSCTPSEPSCPSVHQVSTAAAPAPTRARTVSVTSSLAARLIARLVGVQLEVEPAPVAGPRECLDGAGDAVAAEQQAVLA